jgi:hypothetical protein
VDPEQSTHSPPSTGQPVARRDGRDHVTHACGGSPGHTGFGGLQFEADVFGGFPDDLNEFGQREPE